jgi:hypothetical protein
MYGRIIDENNPRYRGPLPKPRGLLLVPPEIADEVARDQAAHQPNYSDDYAKLTRDDWTLRQDSDEHRPAGLDLGVRRRFRSAWTTRSLRCRIIFALGAIRVANEWIRD